MLCCPGCRGELEEKGPVPSLVCSACGELFSLTSGIPEMFSRPDLLDQVFQEYRRGYEEHAKEDLFSVPSDITQWSCLETLAAFMGPSQNELVLDAGSADGKLGEIVPGQVVCYDISITNLKAAQGKGLPVIAGKAEALPFKRVFDIVILSNILEHVPHPESVIGQVNYVLKPAGRLYVVVPFKEDLFWQEGEDLLDPHLTSFDLPRIKHLLRDFRITRQKFILFMDSRFVYRLKTSIRGRFPHWRKRLLKLKGTVKGREEVRKFPRWRHALNRIPNGLVLPFFRPYSILIEAKKSAP